MPGLTDKRADPAANGPSFPVESEQPTEPAFDLAEPINQIYEFGEFSFEMEFLVDGAPLVKTERAEPWLSDPGESKFDLRPEGSNSLPEWSTGPGFPLQDVNFSVKSNT